MQVVPLQRNEEDQYTTWLVTQPHAMLYHSLPYMRMIAALTSGTLTIYTARDSHNTLRGAMPVIQRDGPYGTILNSLPYYGSHGGLIYETTEASLALINYWNQLATSSHVATATMIENLLDEQQHATHATHTLQDVRIGQMTPIGFDINHGEMLMQRYHSKTRNMVRKSEKQGFSVTIENNAFSFLYQTHLDNMRVIGGTAKSKDFFDAVPTYFTAGKDYNIWVARHNDTPVAAMLLFYFRDIVEYFTPVIVEQWREAQPLSLLIHRAMSAASESGYQYWNWGGTWLNQEGVYHFKKRWGAEDKRYHYYTHIQNSAIYRATPAELLQHYSGFYALPFPALQSNIDEIQDA